VSLCVWFPVATVICPLDASDGSFLAPDLDTMGLANLKLRQDAASSLNLLKKKTLHTTIPFAGNAVRASKMYLLPLIWRVKAEASLSFFSLHDAFAIGTKTRKLGKIPLGFAFVALTVLPSHATAVKGATPASPTPGLTTAAASPTAWQGKVNRCRCIRR